MAMSEALAGRIQGMREVKAAFQALPQIVRERMNVATELTAREIVRAAQGRIAASPSIRTRNLYNSLTWALNKNNGRGKVGVGAGPQARYAHFVEFGTQHAPAEPFMIPAAEGQTKPHLDRCRAAGRGIETDVAAIGGPLSAGGAA